MVARYGHERVKRGLMHFFIGKSVSAIGGFFAMLLVVHGLSIGDFAKYSVLVALVEVFTAVSGFGLSHVILRFVPELYASYQASALRSIILLTFIFRSVLLVSMLGAVWFISGIVSSWIGLGSAVPAFEAFLVVVAFRTTNQFLSQILESTLHQGLAQTAFSVIAIGRLLGMLWLVNNDTVALIDVIWLEAFCEVIAMIVMLAGIFSVLWAKRSHGDMAEPEDAWHKTNRKQLIRFATSAYLQHLATLPFGGNTNRLVGGAMFGEQLMARFGFAQSLYEYIKRYLPTQLLVGLIRPVVVARFTGTRSFSTAADLCEQSLQVNFVLLAGMLAVLLVDGRELLMFISAGKYGASGISVVILCILLAFLALETQRLVLEVLAQMVNHYEIMIPSNVFLSLSVLGGIAAFPVFGAVAFPIANTLALLLANFWVIHRLSTLGFHYRHDWRGTFESLLILAMSAGIGEFSQYQGAHWVAALAITLGVFTLLFLKIKLSPAMHFARELIGNKS